MNLRALFLWIVIVLAVGGGAVFGVVRCEGTPPQLRAEDRIQVGREGARVRVQVADAESGLRRVEAVLEHAGGRVVLLERAFDGSLLRGGAPGAAEPPIELAIDPDALDLAEGAARLRITARDWSLRDALAGNTGAIDLPVAIDLTAPRIRVESGLTYVARGGAAAVVYVVSEPARHGVEVGDAFFPGAALGPAEGGGERSAAVFAVPRNAPPGPRIRVVATDAVGNRSSAGFSTRLRERVFPEAVIRLQDEFLEGKVRELAQAHGYDAGDRVAAFAAINSELRAANEARVRELLSGPPGERLFSGAFLQLRGSLVTSRFAEQRSYLVNGAKVSEATHYGYDLASTAAAPVSAANRGRVVFAGELGIYGGCVLLDHGLGVSSLYGHLSRIDVEPGDVVERGATLGLTGDTGLAGGDHLHFAILVGGTYVDPLEWWDPSWVRERIEARLAPPPP